MYSEIHKNTYYGWSKNPNTNLSIPFGHLSVPRNRGSWRLLVTLTSIWSEAYNPEHSPGPSWTGHVYHTCGFELEIQTPRQGVEPRWSRHKKQSWLPTSHTTDCEFTTLNRRGRAWRVTQRSNFPGTQELVRKHLVTRHIRHFIRNYTPTDPRRSCDLTFAGCLHDHETRTILLTGNQLCHWSKCLFRY